MLPLRMPTATISDVPAPGQLVTVRQRRFVVTGIERSGLQLDVYAPLNHQRHVEGDSRAAIRELLAAGIVEQQGEKRGTRHVYKGDKR